VSRGRITPATRDAVQEWLARFDVCDEVHFALEGATGWRFVVEETRWRCLYGEHIHRLVPSGSRNEATRQPLRLQLRTPANRRPCSGCNVPTVDSEVSFDMADVGR
jgi:hypothetical protein